MPHLLNHTLDECNSCSKEYSSLWKFFLKRTNSYSSQWKMICRLPTEGWKMLQCPDCANALVIKEPLTRPTFNSRYEINYRFISEQDAKFVIRWSRSEQNIPNFMQPILKEIGASNAQWYEESSKTPCSVTLKTGETLDCVECVFAHSPPIPNRKRSSIEEASFWDGYQQVILIDEVEEIAHSPYAMSKELRLNYEKYCFPGVERRSAAFLNIKDHLGNIVSTSVPPPIWCDDERFAHLSAKPIKTGENDGQAILKPFTKDVSVLIFPTL